MAVQIQKNPGDTLHVYAEVKNGVVAQTAIVYFALDGPSHFSSGWSEPMDMNPLLRYEIPMSMPIPAEAANYPGIYDVTIYVWDYDKNQQVVERTFPGEVEILEPTGPSLVTVEITNKNAPTTWKYTHDLVAGWNLKGYPGETTAVRNAVESIQAYLLEIGHYIGETYYEYGMDDIIDHNSACWINVSQACTWGMPPKVAPSYWAGLANKSIPSCPFTPLNQNFNWTIYADELVMFVCYDATYHVIDTPNSGVFLDWGTFIDGETYTWDWATGQLEGVFV